MSQNQILSEVVKTVDSTCPDPFIEPEKFSVFFAQKSIASRSRSDELFEDSGETEELSAATTDRLESEVPVPVENALVRLQNLRMEEQKSFQIERENYETRLGQLSLLQHEIEILRKQNSEHEIQMEFWKSKNSLNEPTYEEMKSLSDENRSFAVVVDEYKRKIDELTEAMEIVKGEKVQLENEISCRIAEFDRENNSRISELNASEYKIKELQGQLVQLSSSTVDSELKEENDQLRNKLEEALLSLKSQQESSERQEEKDRQFRDLSEENVRLKMEFIELEKELKSARVQLNDFEKGIASPSGNGIELGPEDESAFKYVYLSNLVLKFMQFPEKRTALSNIILTTLQSDQEYFQKAMSKQRRQ